MKRERSPFVFLPAMKFVMDFGGKEPGLYEDFEQWFINAYMALRIRHQLLFTLFILMIPSEMPELICKNDLLYMKEMLNMTDIDLEQIEISCKKVIKKCLTDRTRILDNVCHALKHG